MNTYEMDPLVLQVMKETVKANSDSVHRNFFVDKHLKVAYGGHRRTWGYGDLFTRFSGEFNFQINPGLYNFETNEFMINEELKGQKVEGVYTDITINDVENKFYAIYESVSGGYSIDLNPKELIEFIDDATFRKGKRDAVINLQPTLGLSGRQFPAQVFKVDNKWIIEIQTPNGAIAALVQETGSYVNFNKIKDGDYYLCEILGEIDGHRVVTLLRPYVAGIRVAVQHFPNGTYMPGTPGYSVIPYQDGNTLQTDEVTDIQFLPSQNTETVKGAPMLTIQLDTFLRILKSCATFKYIRLTYINEYSPFLVETIDNVEYKVEIIASPMSPYKKGKVITL